MNRRHGALTVLAATTALVLGLAPAALASSRTAADPDRALDQSAPLRDVVSADDVRTHLQEFQKLADEGNGTRFTGSTGFNRSADYVLAKARAAGLEVRLQPFAFQFNGDETAPVVANKAPGSPSYRNFFDFVSFFFSGNGDVTAPVYAVDTIDPTGTQPGTSTSGCEESDFNGFPAGSIALVQRGTCDFVVKASNAQKAGAKAVIIYNEGQPGRTAAIGAQVPPNTIKVPLIFASYGVGDALSSGVRNGATGTTARVKVDRVTTTKISTNVIAETPTGDADNVIVVGAHLDSVNAGPGINDNGSGSAGILAIAEGYKKAGITPRNKVRFMWYGAEELGLLGSRHYVTNLPAAERSKIKLMLNFDMIGSPNYARFVYDGDNSAFPVGPGAAKGPAGSAQIEQVFHDYFRSKDLKSSETPFTGRSDYGPFVDAGIPAGGLFTGAEGLMTATEVAEYDNGVAGEAYDACYHQACDNIDNVNMQALDEMTDAAAHATYVYTQRNFVKKPLVDPAGKVSGTSATPSGGGGLHAHDHNHELDEALAR